MPLRSPIVHRPPKPVQLEQTALSAVVEANIAWIEALTTKPEPNLWASVKHLDGKWRGEPTSEPTKTQAQRWAERRQGDIDAGKPDPRKAATCGELFDTWSKALTNRSSSKAFGTRSLVRGKSKSESAIAATAISNGGTRPSQPARSGTCAWPRAS